MLDFETDPFLPGRVPYPFAACVYFSDSEFAIAWEPNIIDKVVACLRALPPCTLYAHNGGKFDFHFFLEYAEPGTIVIRNGRICEMHVGKVLLKDSFPLMPFALAEFKKDDIDYNIFESHRRNLPQNIPTIRNYLISDCRNLLDLVLGFRAIVGNKDTIGSAAFHQMRKLGIKIPRLNEQHDEIFRPFFFGGRVQAFKHGKFNGRFLYIDVNSAYPFAMRTEHPSGSDYVRSNELPHIQNLGPHFIRIDATSDGALPMRAADGGLSFPHARAIFHTTGWELGAALDTNRIQIHNVLDVWTPQETINFAQYVDTFFALRQQAKADGDEVKRLAYKYLLNSGYGKFAQNPRDFKEYIIAIFGDDVPGYDWETDYGALSLWSRPTFDGRGFFDVCTSASITGFQRANLWRAICSSSGVLYCDTDALICESTAVDLGDALGEWKIEGVCAEVVIAGKKLYGVQWENSPKGEYKIASKGARLSYKQLLELAEGETVHWESSSPNFSATMAGSFMERARFVARDIKATV